MSKVFKELVVDEEINGIKVPVNVSIKVENDDIEFDGDDERDIARHKSGKLFMGVIFVEASALNLEGSEVLGGCSLRPNNAFNSEPFETDVNTTIQEYKMIENAVANLVENIKSQAALLKRFA